MSRPSGTLSAFEASPADPRVWGSSIRRRLHHSVGTLLHPRACEYQIPSSASVLIQLQICSAVSDGAPRLRGGLGDSIAMALPVSGHCQSLAQLI